MRNNLVTKAEVDAPYPYSFLQSYQDSGRVLFANDISTWENTTIIWTSEFLHQNWCQRVMCLWKKNKSSISCVFICRWRFVLIVASVGTEPWSASSSPLGNPCNIQWEWGAMSKDLLLCGILSFSDWPFRWTFLDWV